MPIVTYCDLASRRGDIPKCLNVHVRAVYPGFECCVFACGLNVVCLLGFGCMAHMDVLLEVYCFISYYLLYDTSTLYMYMYIPRTSMCMY